MFLDFNKRPVSAAQDKNSYLQSSAGSVVGFAWQAFLVWGFLI